MAAALGGVRLILPSPPCRGSDDGHADGEEVTVRRGNAARHGGSVALALRPCQRRIAFARTRLALPSSSACEAANGSEKAWPAGGLT